MHKNYLNRMFVLALLASMVVWALPFRVLAQKPAGIDLAGMDKSVNPGDDFFAYANGGWVKSDRDPGGDRSSFGAFDMIFDEVSKRNGRIHHRGGTITRSGSENGRRLLRGIP